MTHGSAFEPGPRVSVCATNPWFVAQTVHRPKDKITTPRLDQARGINSLKDPSVDQEDKDEPEKQYTSKEGTSLAGQASLARGEATTRSTTRKRPASGAPVLATNGALQVCH